jgi:uncharacterized protein (DUF305 family)
MSGRGSVASVLAASVLGATCVAACGKSSPPSVADRNFVVSMVPHHHLGMVLLDDAAPRVADVRLRRLVFEMSDYHHAETSLLEHRLDDWQLDGASSFAGELSAADLSRLDAAEGDDYDVLWLRLMIAHHRGALVLADSQIAHGTVDELVVMARSVRDVQQDQIDEMRDLLAELCTESTLGSCDEELDAD